MHQEAGRPFQGFQKNISYKAVADDDIGSAFYGAAALHVANEVNAALITGLLEQLMDHLILFIAFAGFCADVQQAYARGFGTQNLLGVKAPMKANCIMYSGVQSALAPASMRTALPVRVGITGATAARRMPGIRLTSRVAPERMGAGTAGGEKCVAGAAFQQL